MAISPERRLSSRWFATTRCTIGPIVCRPTLSSRAIGERHLLRQPRHDVFEVARVVRARPGPRDRLQPDATVLAAKAAQLALDDAAAGAEVQVPPALQSPVVDLELAAGLTARGADTPATPQAQVTITPSLVKLTSVIDAPGRRSRRLNAVTTCTSPSLQGRRT
jgi:hypothetical protein